MPGVYADLDLSPTDLELARRQRAAAGNLIDLSSSNPTAQGLIFPPELLRAAADDFWSLRRYAPDPRGSQTARAAIRSYYGGRQPPLSVALDDLFITASSSEAYALLFALLADPGDNLLAPNVTYPSSSTSPHSVASNCAPTPSARSRVGASMRPGCWQPPMSVPGACCSSRPTTPRVP